MSDANLLIFGCAVSFMAVAGAYVYLRECFTAEKEQSEARERTNVVEGRFQDVA